MGSVHPAVLFIIQAGAVAAAVTGILVLIEKLWSPVSNFLQRQINEPVEQKIIDLTDKLDKHTEYVQYHLGPNGGAPSVHSRVQRIEEIVDAEV
jgi:hypothetical protein